MPRRPEGATRLFQRFVHFTLSMICSCAEGQTRTIHDDRTSRFPAQKAIELFDRKHPRPDAPSAPDGNETPLEFRLANRAGGLEAAVGSGLSRRQYAARADNELRPDAVHDGSDELAPRGPRWWWFAIATWAVAVA